MRRLVLCTLLLLGWAAAALADGEDCFPLGAGACVRAPNMSGAFPPAACTTGELFLDTNETVDTNCTTTNDNSLCLCIASGSWVQLNNN